MTKMVPKTLIIASSYKAYRTDRTGGGRTKGSEVTVVFEVDKELTPKEFVRLRFEEKENLDKFVLQAELLRGMPKDEFDLEMATLKSRYNKLLGRTGEVAPDPGEESTV